MIHSENDGGLLDASKPLRITVAICTWNRADLLRQTLESLTRLQIPADVSFKLLVVNNNSTDATESVAQSFAASLPLSLVLEPSAGIAHARNRALREARQAESHYLVFTDDDVLVSPEWLSGFAGAARRHPHAAAFGGPIDPWFAHEPDPDLAAAFPNLRLGFCGLDHQLPEGSISENSSIATTNLLYGVNMALCLPVIGDLQFDPAMGAKHTQAMLGEEFYVLSSIRQKGQQIIWVPSMRLRHYVPAFRMTLEYLQRYYEGLGRTDVRIYGLPASSTFLGAPRWLQRKRYEARLRWLWKGVMRQRVESLTALREYSYYTGMSKEAREGGSEGFSPTAAVN